MKIFLVGGAVRDRLLDRPVRERDWVVVGATPEEMQRRGYREKATGFPVYLHPESGEEYALARRETKSGVGYKGFTFDCSPSVSREEDLARRDLTVNAIALSDDGEVVDPFDGCSDLQARSLKHITTAFIEDPLRVLRLARFLAELGEYKFNICDTTQSLALQMCRSGELATLSPSRIWRESVRALDSTMPQLFFQQLIAWDALSQLMPWMQPENGSDLRAPIGALKCAVEQNSGTDVRLATLLASIAQERGKQADIPTNWPLSAIARSLADLCVTHPLPKISCAESTLHWLESVDAWRRADRFVNLLRVWLALRPNLSVPIERLRQCRDQAHKVPKPAAGADPRSAVRAYRLQQIALTLQ
jgi:tRNA nucleotidyltransferase (CCA-adding enzyme)